MHLILISTLCVLRARHYFLVVGTSSVLEFQFGVCLAGKTPFFKVVGTSLAVLEFQFGVSCPFFCTSAVLLIEVDASCGQDTPFWWVVLVCTAAIEPKQQPTTNIV